MQVQYSDRCLKCLEAIIVSWDDEKLRGYYTGFMENTYFHPIDFKIVTGLKKEAFGIVSTELKKRGIVHEG